MKLTIPQMWSDVAPYVTASDWLTLADVRAMAGLSLGRVKQGLGAGSYLGLVEHQVEKMRTGQTHWKRRRYRLKVS